MGVWTQVGAFISNVGFPVFVAVYVLLRLEPTIRDLQRTITVLTIVVAKATGGDYEEACRLAGKNGR